MARKQLKTDYDIEDIHPDHLSEDDLVRYAALRDGQRRPWRASPDEQRRSKYRIKPGQFEALLASQKALCAICTEPMLPCPCVDHDHDTGAIRGLLCRRCNSGIGFLRDNPTICKSAADYLTKHGK